MCFVLIIWSYCQFFLCTVYYEVLLSNFCLTFSDIKVTTTLFCPTQELLKVHINVFCVMLINGLYMLQNQLAVLNTDHFMNVQKSITKKNTITKNIFK